MWQMNCDRWVNLRNILLFLLLFFSGLTSCSTVSDLYDDSNSDPHIVKKIESFYHVWVKTPYRYGGNSLKGTDCSGLTKIFYQQKVGKTLPRITTKQARIGKEVNQLSAGDLVFFKSGRGTTGLHVGIYYKNGLFLHVSSKKGVQYANLKDDYWRKKYWKARRIID